MEIAVDVDVSMKWREIKSWRNWRQGQWPVTGTGEDERQLGSRSCLPPIVRQHASRAFLFPREKEKEE